MTSVHMRNKKKRRSLDHVADVSRVPDKPPTPPTAGLDLFNFMQSFGGVQNVGPNHLLVPSNVLDAWYARLSHRLRRDPEFLTRNRDKV